MTEKQVEFIRKLVKTYSNTLIKVAYRKTGNEHKAEDLVQNVLTTACLKVDELMNHPQPAAWLYEALNNLLMNENKKAFNRFEVSLDESKSSHHGKLEHELPLEFSLPRGLSAEDRELLILHFQYNMSAQEIARIKGIRDDVIRKRLSRAVARCRKLFLK